MALILGEDGGLLLTEAGGDVLGEGAGTVTVTGSWPGQWAAGSGYGSFPPAAMSLRVPVTNTGTGGNWLFALCAWRTPPGVQTTVAVGDDSFNEQPGCNVWEPLGAPAGTSPLPGIAAGSIWYCRNALPARNVYVSPDGLITSMAVLVIEVSGLSPQATLAAIATGYVPASATGPSLSGSPSASSLMLTLAATDNDTLTVTGPGAGWTALTRVVASDATDHAADIVLTPAYQVTSSPVTASWSSSSAQDTAAILGGVLVTGDTPVPPSQTWPYIQFQAGFGSGAHTPWDQVGWTDLTPRFRSGSAQRGKQYELDAIQAGTMNLMLSNNDGALNPGNAASPYFPQVQVNTPARLLATWPPPPDPGSRTYSVWRGFIERWPSSLTPARYQVTNTTGTDVYALLTTLMQSLPRAEILVDVPYAYWPLSDAAGSGTGANHAKGNSQALQQVQSKYGSGGAAASFGVSIPYLAGDPSCTGWQQASVPAADTQGWCLYYQDTGLPAISNGITLEGEFAAAVAQPTGKTVVLIGVRNAAGSVLTVQVSPAGILQLSVRDRLTGTATVTNISTAGMLTGIPVHVAVSFTQSSWTLYLDGGALRTVTGSCNLAASGYWLCYGGLADRAGASNFANVTIAHLAVYGYLVSQARIASHWYAAVTAMAGQDTSGARADRLLGDGGTACPRIMPGGNDLFTGAVDISGQAVSQNIVNIAESDSAWLMVNSAGYLALQDRRAGYNLPVQWTFGELQGEYAYLGDIATDCDPSQAFNDNTLSQLAAPSVSSTTLQVLSGIGATSLTVISAAAVTVGQVLILDPGTSVGELVAVSAVAGNVLTVTACAYAHAANATVTVITTSTTGVTVTASWQASIDAYGDQTLQQTSYLVDPAAITDQVWWITNTTGIPVNRIANMTLDPAANPALWPVVLGLETGQVVAVNRRLQGTLLVMSGQFQVMSVGHNPGPRTWQTKVALVPYPGRVLACDDPVYGLPGQQNSIGW